MVSLVPFALVFQVLCRLFGRCSFVVAREVPSIAYPAATLCRLCRCLGGPLWNRPIIGHGRLSADGAGGHLAAVPRLYLRVSGVRGYRAVVLVRMVSAIADAAPVLVRVHLCPGSPVCHRTFDPRACFPLIADGARGVGSLVAAGDDRPLPNGL